MKIKIHQLVLTSLIAFIILLSSASSQAQSNILELGTSSASPGQNVALELKITNPTNVSKIDLYLSYNESLASITNFSTQSPIITAVKEGKNFSINSTQNLNQNTTLLLIEFGTNENAMSAIPIKISGKLNNGQLNATFIGGEIIIEIPSCINVTSGEILNDLDDNCNGFVDEGFWIMGDYNSTYECLDDCNIDCAGNICKATGNFRITLLEELVSNGTSLPQPLLEFDWDSSKKKIDLTQTSITQSVRDNRSSALFHGFENILSEDSTKTVYLKKLNDFNSVCIKDSQVSDISEISQNCNSENELILQCNSEFKESYRCSLLGNLYKVEGLKNSALIEFNSTNSDGSPNQNPPDNSGGNSNSGGSGSSGSGGSSSSSRSGTTPFSKTLGANCETYWTCSEWSACMDGVQTRTCEKVISSCSAAEKPDETKSCDFSDTSDNLINESSPAGITGAAIGGGRSVNAKRIVGLAAFLIIFLALLSLILKIKRLSKRRASGVKLPRY